MFGGVLGSLKIPVIADLKQFEEGIAKAEIQAKAGGVGIGGALKGAMLPAMVGAAAGIGLAAIAIKSVVEISDKWEASQKGLTQATQQLGFSTDLARYRVDQFIRSNTAFVSNQAEVVDSYAALVRMGLNYKQVQDDLNLALDLSKLRHISLTEATLFLQQAEMGRGRALLPLGINMKEYPVLTETAVVAARKLTTAEDAVTKATAAHTAALKAHGPQSAQAQASAKTLADANAKLAEAHNYTANRAAASAEVHDRLHKALDGGRQTTSDLEQASNKLGNTWQGFAQKTGPSFLKIFTAALEILGKVADAIGWVLQKSLDLQNAIGKIAGNLPVIGGIQSTFAAGSGGVPAGSHVGPHIAQPIQPAASVGGGVTVVQHIYGHVMTDRQTLEWARDGIRRLDRAQS